MKIALVIWELNLKGGTQRLALELANELQNLGNTVDVYCYFYDNKQGYADLCKKVPIYSVQPLEIKKDTNKKKTLFSKLWYFPGIYLKLIKNLFVAEKNIQELAHLIEKTKGVSYYDAINVHDYTAYRIARLIKHKNIVWTMNDIQRPPLTGKSFLHNTLFNFFQKIVATYEIKNIKKIVVLDKRNVALAKSYYNRDSIIVRGGMDLDMFKNITIEKVFKKDRYQLFLSSIFFPWRRFEDVVDAVEILKNKGYTNFNVHINGVTDRAPSYYLSILDRITKKNVGNYIHITTGLSESELMQAYAKTDIFIFPNHNQTWGLAVFEAMLAGCATIVSKTSGASEILTDNENALLVSPKSPQEIAEKVALLLDDPKKIESISKNGIEFVRKNLSWKRYAQEMSQILTL